MFVISNARRFGDLSFHNAKGRPVILRPGKEREFAVDEINVGLLRVMLGKGSHYKVRADSEEAETLVKLAMERKEKTAGSAIVHGTTDPKPVDFVSVRDLKNANRPVPKDGDRVFINEEQMPSTPKQPEQPPAPPEKSTMEKLIEGAAELPFSDFRTQAKELLGEDFPTGNPGRPALLDALKKKQASDLSALAQAE